MRLIYDPKKPKPKTRTVRVSPHEAQHNPEGWKWRLVLMLTGGQIEAVPFMPHRPIAKHETLVIKLGTENALNTAEVKMPKVTELIEIGLEHLAPDTFVALDVADSVEMDQRYVGTITGVDKDCLFLRETISSSVLRFKRSEINRAFWAPMGYRA